MTVLVGLMQQYIMWERIPLPDSSKDNDNDSANSVTEGNLNSYYVTLRRELNYQDLEIRKLWGQAFNLELTGDRQEQRAAIKARFHQISPADLMFKQVELAKIQFAVSALAVKTELYGNFYGRPSTEQSEMVREALKQLFVLPTVEVGHMTIFSDVVAKEKERLGLT